MSFLTTTARQQPLRMQWLVFLALATQLVAVLLVRPGSPHLGSLMLVLAYGLLIPFFAMNWRRLSMAVVALGTLMNLVVIAANGGAMPVTHQAFGLGEPVGSVSIHEALVPYSKDRLMSGNESHLSFLSDTIALPRPFRVVVSPGDLVIASGLVLFAAESGLTWARRRAPPVRN